MIRAVVGSYEHSTKHVGFINNGKVINRLSSYQLLKNISIELKIDSRQKIIRNE
jgi:hypothetical protein